MAKQRPEEDGRWASLQEFGEQVLRPRRKDLQLTQPQVAERIGIDQSRISRIEHGERPDYAIAQRLIEVYQLAPKEAERWLELAFGASPTYVVPSEDLEFADDLLRAIRAVRIAGNPHQAIQLSDSLNRWLIQKEQRASPAEQRYIREKRGWALLEKGATYRDFLTGQEILIVTRPVLEEVKTIAIECADEELLGMVGHQLGSVCYIAEDYRTAIQYYEKYKDFIKIPEEQLVILSGLALAWGYLGGREQLRRVVAQFNDMLRNTEYSDLPAVCDALQTVVRAQGLLQIEGAWRTFEQLQHFCLKKDQLGQLAPMRDVQLERARVELITRFEPWHKGPLENYGEQGLSLAKKYGFRRHEQQIRKLLEEALD